MDLEDIHCLLNPVLQADLRTILELTPYDRRLDVTKAFCRLTDSDWAARTGMSLKNVSRWFNGRNKLPFGAAYRLAQVVGVEPTLLFEGYVRERPKRRT